MNLTAEQIALMRNLADAEIASCKLQLRRSTRAQSEIEKGPVTKGIRSFSVEQRTAYLQSMANTAPRIEARIAALEGILEALA